MTERSSKGRFACDPYTRLMYGYLEYCLWREQKDEWDKLKTQTNGGANSQQNESKNCWADFADEEEEKEEILEAGKFCVEKLFLFFHKTGKGFWVLRF